MSRTSPSPPSVTSPVTRLKGVGPRVAERLKRIGIEQIGDVLFHLPSRYEDRTRITPMGATRPGMWVAVCGEIELTQVSFGRRRSLLCRISDGTGALTCRFFHFTKAQQQALARTKTLFCYGEVRNGTASLEMVHPEYQVLDDDTAPDLQQTMTPIYPTTEGLHQLSLRKLTEQALSLLHEHAHLLPDYLADLETDFSFKLSLPEAIECVHRPTLEEDLHTLLKGQHPAQQRLAFEELLAHQISMKLSRETFKENSAPRITANGKLRESLLANLPFSPTPAQTRVVSEILKDLDSHHPMSRLVQGDVGSGKTLVAALAALQAIEAGYQVAMMAPTELLAEQHLQNFRHWLSPLGIDVVWLSGKMKAAERQAALQQLAEEDGLVAVGTHALFQQDVQFKRLGLSIVDEQHRFGVHQRLALREKSAGDVAQVSHQLIMTATPIPRTLAMTAYADLDVSVIDELPPGRQPVETIVIADTRKAQIIERMKVACEQGRQIYWVCTLIEESEALQCQAATETADQLRSTLPHLSIGLVHGRMKKDEKSAVMQAFAEGHTHILVATTVIEVGVDVPNASLMIIENAERLGLAQLHQLRGRVGRGSQKSDCVLLYHGPLSKLAKRRLSTLRETSDGFKIAQEDLAIRGPGEFLGTRQAGLMRFRIADLLRDESLLPDVERLAEHIVQERPELTEPLIARWLLHGMDYADV